jgi:hypothetical protein
MCDMSESSWCSIGVELNETSSTLKALKGTDIVEPTFLGEANAHQRLRTHKRLEPKACGNDHTQLAHDKRMDCATDLTRTNHVESAAQVISKERLHTWLWGAQPKSHTFKMLLINKHITTRSLHMTNGWTWCATDLTSTNNVESAAQVISKERLHTWLWGTIGRPLDQTTTGGHAYIYIYIYLYVYVSHLNIQTTCLLSSITQALRTH